MTRSSIPSKRPQTRTTPGPWLSASTRAWVSCVPRGESRQRGRESWAISGTVASMARPSTSAFITMPGPPPAGVSSTLRCLSVAEFRISATSSDQTPAAKALPARLAPSGPGNISGKIVSTLARHISIALYRRHDDDLACGNVDRRHVGLVERQQFRFVAGFRVHFDQIAGAEIVDGDDGAEFLPGAVDDGQPDEIGMIEFVRLFRRRQPFARHVELGVLQELGGITIGDAENSRDEMILRRSQCFDLEDAAVVGLERTVVHDCRRISGEGMQGGFAA